MNPRFTNIPLLFAHLASEQRSKSAGTSGGGGGAGGGGGLSPSGAGEIEARVSPPVCLTLDWSQWDWWIVCTAHDGPRSSLA